ncbi:MAG: hypothetical protein Q8K89_06250, partial [Actinomycetota bacterium]|nr:hypothetical protein [Actinomycetota bacterium]
MRQGITGLVVGLAAGAMLAGSAAFAVNAVGPTNADTGQSVRATVRTASQMTSGSVDSTRTAHPSTEASTTRHPSMPATQTPVAHMEREHTAAMVAEPAAQAPHHTMTTVPAQPATTQNPNHMTD